MDNLDMLQWLKQHADAVGGGAGCTGPRPLLPSAGAPANPKKRVAAAAPAPARTAAVPRLAAAAPAAAPSAVVAAAAKTSAAQAAALGEQVAALRLALERSESEREFFFEKLQDVELLCQRPIFAGQPVVGIIEKILYAVDGKPDIEAEVRLVAASQLAAAGFGGTPAPSLALARTAASPGGPACAAETVAEAAPAEKSPGGVRSLESPGPAAAAPAEPEMVCEVPDAAEMEVSMLFGDMEALQNEAPSPDENAGEACPLSPCSGLPTALPTADCQPALPAASPLGDTKQFS